MSRKSWKSGYWGSDGNDPEALAWGPCDTPEQARSHPGNDVDEDRLDLFAFHIDWSEADDPADDPPKHSRPCLSPNEMNVTREALAFLCTATATTEGDAKVMESVIAKLEALGARGAL